MEAALRQCIAVIARLIGSGRLEPIDHEAALDALQAALAAMKLEEL